MSPPRIPLWFVTLLAIGAAFVLAPFAPWMALALWLGLYARRFHAPLTRKLGGRKNLAATLTVSMLLVIAIPLGAIMTSLALDAIALVQRIAAAEETQQVLSTLVTRNGNGHTEGPSVEPLDSANGIIGLIMSQGDRALGIIRMLADATLEVVVGLLVMVMGIYGVLVEGSAWYHWVERHTPLDERHFHRLRDAFMETGRGLWWGIIGAGILQSLVATTAYVALGVPSALALGMLTLVMSLLPAIGTALVWGPVAAALALTGRPVAAVVLACVGVFVVSTVDNLARPWLARRGELQLPTWVVLLAMFGGLELFGGWGILMGPLIVRLAKEALAIYRDERAAIAVVKP